MNLTQEQRDAVAKWVAAGDSLAAIQKKLREQFQVGMTYMDVRFLVDDLNLSLKDAAPKADASDVTKTPPAAKPADKKGFLDKAKEKLGLAKDEEEVDGEDYPADEELAAEGSGEVKVTVDKVTLLPGAAASGSVAFSNGVTGKWIVDNYGRPGLTEVSKPGYRPSAADSQAFMQELGAALQGRGL